MTEVAHFKFLQSERKNIITINSETFLTNQMSGSVIIADVSSGSFTVKLPKPESGLNYKIILKASTTVFLYKLTLQSTSDDTTTSGIIHYIGGFTSPLDEDMDADDTTNDLQSTNILSVNGTDKIVFGKTYTDALGETSGLNASNIKLYNTSGDFIDIICDGTNWYGSGMTKNKSVYKG
tara:strand:- start:58 stop:594 length:537 start_codon:yes stop_codon:yes gene_type:complete